ncbi:hypothetical protein NKI46_28695 [Mesorhizobium sp. M0615]|uniref:hypothetical protein n=1 Tax=Mesorhizobium sp. M0615 TaxID=2956971 RepID=UPI00333D1223
MSAVVGPVFFWGAVIWYFASGGTSATSEAQKPLKPAQVEQQTGYGAASNVPEEVRQKALVLLGATYDGPLTTCRGHDIDGVYLAYCLRNGLEEQGGGLYAVLGAMPSLFSVYPINGKAKGHLEGHERIIGEFGQRTRIGKWDGKPIDIGFATKMLVTQFK